MSDKSNKALEGTPVPIINEDDFQRQWSSQEGKTVVSKDEVAPDISPEEFSRLRRGDDRWDRLFHRHRGEKGDDDFAKRRQRLAVIETPIVDPNEAANAEYDALCRAANEKDKKVNPFHFADVYLQNNDPRTGELNLDFKTPHNTETMWVFDSGTYSGHKLEGFPQNPENLENWINGVYKIAIRSNDPNVVVMAVDGRLRRFLNEANQYDHGIERNWKLAYTPDRNEYGVNNERGLLGLHTVYSKKEVTDTIVRTYIDKLMIKLVDMDSPDARNPFLLLEKIAKDPAKLHELSPDVLEKWMLRAFKLGMQTRDPAVRDKAQSLLNTLFNDSYALEPIPEHPEKERRVVRDISWQMIPADKRKIMLQDKERFPDHSDNPYSEVWNYQLTANDQSDLLKRVFCTPLDNRFI